VLFIVGCKDVFFLISVPMELG